MCKIKGTKMLKNKDLEVIIEKYQELLFLYCISRVKNKYDADDIIGKVLLFLCSKKEELTNDNMEAWLFKCVDIYIKRFFRAKQKYDGRNRYINDIDEYNLPYISDNEYVTDHIERIDEKILEYIKNQLPADQRKLFQYKYIENISLTEISNKMNIPYPTIVHRNKKLKEKIREIINEYLT